MMPNPVHLIPVPANRLALPLGETHRRYSGLVNARLRATVHLFRAASAAWRWTNRI